MRGAGDVRRLLLFAAACVTLGPPMVMASTPAPPTPAPPTPSPKGDGMELWMVILVAVLAACLIVACVALFVYGSQQAKVGKLRGELASADVASAPPQPPHGVLSSLPPPPPPPPAGGSPRHAPPPPPPSEPALAWQREIAFSTPGDFAPPPQGYPTPPAGAASPRSAVSLFSPPVLTHAPQPPPRSLTSYASPTAPAWGGAPRGRGRHPPTPPLARQDSTLGIPCTKNRDLNGVAWSESVYTSSDAGPPPPPQPPKPPMPVSSRRRNFGVPYKV